MASKTKSRYGRYLPLGELNGETITRRMLKNQEKTSAAIIEFLRFCEMVNRGQIG